jgi:hypothetical protein|tara:strand:+ start:1895 stop:2284 length:390 start_codon:yes stop_codon:yes gene_type:complete
MANTFLRKTSKNIGTSYFQVGANLAGLQGNGNPQTGAYTVGSNTTTTVIGLSVANVTGTSVEVDVALSATMANTTNDVALASSVPIPSGSVLVLVGGDQKLNLATSDLIKVKSSAATSLDVVMSILEIT